MQTGQDLGVAIVIQTDTADQELLVYLTHHRAGASRLTLCHGRGYLKPRTMTVVDLQRDKDEGMDIHLYLSIKAFVPSVTFRAANSY